MNVFELFATISLDSSGYREGLSEAEHEAESSGSRIGNALGGIARVAGAATAAAVGAAATGVAALTTQAVNAYGEYEQLSGGIERLFGNAANTVMDYSAEAFANVGMDANTYMQSITSFSAALISSLDGDTQAAAEIANIAMQDLADNANTFGTYTVEELSNVYTALARGQFQTLDNLNLGFAGTQQGMIDLINSSGIFEEEITSLENVSFDQMILAIHEVQEGMSIAGTTANEASGTIQGSLNQLSAAWQNLVIGFANGDADLSRLIGNVVTSARSAVQNLVPAISQALGGIGQLITEVAPIISNELPGLIDELLPPALSAATSLVSALVSSLPSIFSALNAVIPQIIDNLIPAVIETLPLLVSAAEELVLGLATAIGNAAPSLIPSVITAVLTIVEQLTSPDSVLMLVNAAAQLAIGIETGIIQSLPQIVSSIPTIVSNLANALIGQAPELIGAAVNVQGEVFNSILSTFGVSGQDVINAAVTLGNNVVNGFGNALDAIRGVLSDAWNFITNGFANLDISLPHIDLPHFTISGQFSLDPPSVPSLNVSWYAKAMNQPHLLTSPTIFGMGANGLRGGGEAGDELVVGWNQLKQELGGGTPYEIHVHNYIGGDEIDELVLNSNQINNKISGGR